MAVNFANRKFGSIFLSYPFCSALNHSKGLCVCRNVFCATTYHDDDLSDCDASSYKDRFCPCAIAVDGVGSWSGGIENYASDVERCRCNERASTIELLSGDFDPGSRGRKAKHRSKQRTLPQIGVGA